MSIPAWILDTFAAVMLLVAAVSAGQLAVARAWTRAGARDADIAGSHLLMGIAMAGTLVAGLSTLPNAAWEVIFAVMTAWFAWCLWQETRGHGVTAVTRGHHAPHLVHSAAMLYMFAALAGPAPGGGSGMAGMAGSPGGMQSLHAPTLAFVFALLLIAYTVRDLDRKAGADGYFHVVGRRFTPAGPALATAAAGGTGRSVPAGPAGGGDSAVATIAQPQAAPAAEVPSGDGVAGQAEAHPPMADRLLLSPAVVKGCRVTMGVTMAFMLVIMI
jgi:Domain of unknown function (DUF5134)